MKFGIEKAIVAAIEPVLDDVIALEKRVEELQRALVELEKKIARQPEQSSSTAEILRVGKR